MEVRLEAAQLLSATALGDRRRLEQNRHSPRLTAQTHQPAIQARRGKVRLARPHQSLKVKLAPVRALALGLHALAFAPGAARSVAPARSESVSEGFHDHENISHGWQ